MRARRLCFALCLTSIFAACSPEGSGDPGDGGLDGYAGDSSKRARVFAINPVTTPEPIEVGLDVGDDVDGKLTSARDAQGIRKLRAFTCVDEGQIVYVMGRGEQRICTLRQMADRDADGSFVYEDWDEDLAGRLAPRDLHAEVSVFYHAQRFYDRITDPAVGVFDMLPGRHERDGQPVPINLVANYQLPAHPVARSLAPAAVAFFIPAEYMAMGMAEVQGLVGFEGDFLVFGQGEQVDFGYDGETVYHEFGHAVVHATAELAGVEADPQGLTHLGPALNEGLADTFAFLVSENPQLFAFLDARMGGGFALDVREDRTFPADLCGLDRADAAIISSANWDVLSLLRERAGFDEPRFLRVLLLTLLRLADAQAWESFAQYADALLAVLADEGFAEHAPDVRALLEERGLYESLRVVELDQTGMLLTGGAGAYAWNTWLERDEDGASVRIAPAYVQLVAVAPAGSIGLRLEITALRSPMDMGDGELDLDYLLYLRRGEPVRYESQQGRRVSVIVDEVRTPDSCEPVDTPLGPGLQLGWILAGLPSEPSYLQLVNYGSSEGLLFVERAWD
ncbi:MAG: hypothetical protein JXR96_17080 [Deltaproteobacteria bacterium]|nr:hypothetical protein [Deltaproteobacteria bacterium]